VAQSGTSRENAEFLTDQATEKFAQRVDRSSILYTLIAQPDEQALKGFVRPIVGVGGRETWCGWAFQYEIALALGVESSKQNTPNSENEANCNRALPKSVIY
jgi:hypothetical protein